MNIPAFLYGHSRASGNVILLNTWDPRLRVDVQGKSHLYLKLALLLTSLPGKEGNAGKNQGDIKTHKKLLCGTGESIKACCPRQ